MYCAWEKRLSLDDSQHEKHAWSHSSFFVAVFHLFLPENSQHVLSESDVVVLEGTGHTAVGSVVDLNNAQASESAEHVHRSKRSIVLRV